MIDFLTKYKNLTILVIVNVFVVSLIAYGFLYNFKDYNAHNWEQKNDQEKFKIKKLNLELKELSAIETFDDFNLLEQTQFFKIIVSAFNVKIEIFKQQKKGVDYAISGDSKTVLLLSYKLSKAIKDGALKAQIKNMLIKSANSVLIIQIFGVNND